MASSLLQIATAAQDPEFAGRVQAAASVLGIPFHPNQIMHVATHADLSEGPSAVEDVVILALLTPEDAPTGAVESTSTEVVIP